MTKRDEHGERKKARIYDGSRAVAYLFLAAAAILIIQAILGLLSVYGVIQVLPFGLYLSGPTYIVQAFEGFFLSSVIITIAFAGIAVICSMGLLEEQEWAAGISLILMGLIAITMVSHLVINPGIFGALTLVLEIVVFGIALLSSAYIIKHFKRFD